jgi:DNA-binding NarL/FixJ family response regulator
MRRNKCKFEISADGHKLIISIEIPVQQMHTVIHTKCKPGDIDPHTLTSRQIQVLNGMRRGQTHKEIASDLNISESGVKKQAGRVFKRLHVHDRDEIIKTYGFIQ